MGGGGQGRRDAAAPALQVNRTRRVKMAYATCLYRHASTLRFNPCCLMELFPSANWQQLVHLRESAPPFHSMDSDVETQTQNTGCSLFHPAKLD